MTSVHIRRDEDTDMHIRMTIRGHREKTTIYKPKREASEGPCPADTSISDF